LTIARGRFQPPQRDTGKRLRINDLIRISPVRLIDDNDEQVGVIDLDEAKKRAREAGLDLVEVSPLSKPPVCKIMDYGKWKYQQKKKEQKASSHSKQSELKELRLRPKIDKHDLDIKTDRAKEFLGEGDKVQFTMLFRGREMAHQDIGLNTLRSIRDRLSDISKVEAEPKLMGKRMTMVLAPDRKPKSEGKPVAGAPAAHPAGPVRQGGLGGPGAVNIVRQPPPTPAATPASATHAQPVPAAAPAPGLAPAKA
jgi:translation initiation factor IF-3